ncbi:hypothetical protein ZEAMMB73_Zm00001d002097 [Zea mays]|uniref:Uncharacterized protein n=1 Tax=Zea mays TaxID=4577 RepID=A0A1D6DWJ8_MAIZE|nr:hypothetical protein ZEAMMB73_Zm00001d002097 [Zea mays]
MKMRTPAVAFAALLLLLLQITTRAHGIRMDRQLHEAINSKKKMMADPKSGGGGEAASIAAAGDSVRKHCAPDGRRRCSGTTKQMTPTTVVGSRYSEVAMIISAHAAPRFHEDYYGPSGHEPNHH